MTIDVAIVEDDAKYIRGRVSRIYEHEGKLIVKGADTLLNGRPVEIEADKRFAAWFVSQLGEPAPHHLIDCSHIFEIINFRELIAGAAA